jgi:hypothetical protein
MMCQVVSGKEEMGLIFDVLPHVAVVCYRETQDTYLTRELALLCSSNKIWQVTCPRKISKKEYNKCSGDETHYGNSFIQARNKLQQTA